MPRTIEPEAESVAPSDDEPEEDLGVAGDYDNSDSFENAAPTGGDTFRQSTSDAAGETGSAPALEDLVAKIPAETKQVLEELLRARFTTVRRIDPERLR